MPFRTSVTPFRTGVTIMAVAPSGYWLRTGRSGSAWLSDGSPYCAGPASRRRPKLTRWSPIQGRYTVIVPTVLTGPHASSANAL